MIQGFSSFIAAEHSALIEYSSFDKYAVRSKVDRVDPAVFKYIFQLQVAIENLGPMDYRAYATRMWLELLSLTPEWSGSVYRDFESSMIRGLHDIDMSKHVYAHVKESLSGLIESYGDSVLSVILWSTGDVSATGYQVAKIARSGIIRQYRSLMRKNMFVTPTQWKTVYMVEDNKFAKLIDYVRWALATYPPPLKLVVIEDSAKNFEKVASALRLFFPKALIELISIWAVYSREGISEAEKAEKSDTLLSLEARKSVLNAIDSFADLLDTARFSDAFRGAHILVDFDGVIGNNVTMRQEQARVIYGAFRSAAALALQATCEHIDTRTAERAATLIS